MSYLARLKAEFSKKGLPSELTKPTRAPSVSFDSTASSRIAEIEADPNALPDPAAEVRRLIEAIARVSPYWTPADVEEAVSVALTDLDNALTTFRALAERYGVEMH